MSGCDPVGEQKYTWLKITIDLALNVQDTLGSDPLNRGVCGPVALRVQARDLSSYTRTRAALIVAPDD